MDKRYDQAASDSLDHKANHPSGFSAKNAKGNDIVKLLQDAFNRKHLHVKCVALVNDVREIMVMVSISF